jgi:radical SAM protein with 4Fe4S-binding SPASM domain
MATRGPAPGRLASSVVKGLIDEGAGAGQASLGFGGLWEPLLSDDLPEIIAHGREKGLIEAMFNTNGLLLDPGKAERLISSGLTRIMISLDAATPETYRLVRPGGDLSLAESNVLHFLAKRREAKSRLPLTRLSFCLTSLNVHELTPFLARWEDSVDFFSIQSYGRFDDRAPLLFPGQSPADWPSGPCAQPFKRLMVRHDGEVLPCCDLSGLSLTLGDAGQGLARIWAGPALADLRARILSGDFKALPSACQRCQTKYRPPLRED